MARARTTGAGKGRRRGGKPGTPERPREPTLVGTLFEGARVTTSGRAGRAVEPELWHDVVGARIAHRATPGRLRRGVLEVGVASAVWAQELSFLKDDLVARLNAAGVRVSDLSFRVKPTTAAKVTPPAARRPPAPLPADIAERLADVDDPELRAVIADAASHSLAARARATSPQPNARGPRSAVPGSDLRDRSSATPPSTPRRKPGAPRG